jgi:hypothetical protein
MRGQDFQIPSMNKAGNAGLPLPMVDGIAFVDPELVLGQGFIRVDTDVTYTPGAAARPRQWLAE